MNAAARLLNQGALSRGWVVSLFLTRYQLMLVTLTFSVLISALSVVYIANATRGLNAAIHQALTERNRLHVQWGQLLLEKGAWTTQARVQHVAEDRLGMVLPDNKSVVTINE